jgi:MFS family permease
VTGRAERRLVLVGASATVLAVAPVYLLGGLSALIRADLGFDERALGVAASVFFASSALCSIPAGWVAARLGPRRSLASGIATVTLPFAALALVADSWWQLTACLVLAGMANSLIQLSVNLSLAEGIRREHQGKAFGTKQAAVPLATLLAGLAVPAIGLTVGWRFAFLGAAVASASLLLALRIVPRGGRAAGTRRSRFNRARLRKLLAVVVAAGCATATANAAGTFFVEWAVRLDQPLHVAGLVFSAASLAAISGRVTVGWMADRSSVDQFRVMGVMMAVGSFGYIAIGASAGLLPLTAAALVAFAAGWGWPGLLHMSVIRENRDAPAEATGIMQTGIFLGGIVGPAGFGATAAAFGYPPAWNGAAAVTLFGAAMLLLSRRGKTSMPDDLPPVTQPVG